ncbi:hypothetical protein FACS189472_11810 [Alphaproteobacteria bacterium]|nr:hypothetical protein FACS189472_11810 [Alphaproteobacteria bacterium]
MHEALEELKVLSADEDFRAEYNAHIKAQNNMISRETNAEARGIAIGEEKGKAEGKAEKAKETALNALAIGLTTEQIAGLTGLTVDEINSLKH